MADSPSTANAELLDYVERAGLWIRAKKTKPIWARRLSQPECVLTLEGEEWAAAGSFVCRGEAGDLWPQSAERLESKYQATEETLPGGWRKYEPRYDNHGVWAARMDQAFSVQSAWGRLEGKPGDYLLKDVEFNGSREALWIVDAALFAATYQRLGDQDVL